MSDKKPVGSMFSSDLVISRSRSGKQSSPFAMRRKAYELGFVSYEMHGNDVYSDEELQQRLTETYELTEGSVIYVSGLMGEIRRVIVEKCHDGYWHGHDGHMMVGGHYDPKRYAHELFVEEPDGGWVASCFGDMKAFARARF